MAVKCSVIFFVFSCLIGTLRANKDISYSIDSVSLHDATVISLEERHRRQADDTPAVGNTQGDATTVPNLLDMDILHDEHTYYKSTMLLREMADMYWVELMDQVGHQTLSDSHRTAVTARLPFQFPFYGHTVTNITIATGGFIYMSPFIHKFLTATQYIAPLMANFDTKSGGKNSTVVFKQVDQKFVVEWRNVHLQDQNGKADNGTGTFQFQVILHYNGSIIFVYKKLPIPIGNISSASHPVKIGLSDAFYFDSTTPFGKKRRTIYEYHRVVLNTTEIQEGTVIILHPKPTCNKYTDCESCVTASIGFTCKWCGIIQRCSDSVDWHRQEWLKAGCVHLSGSANCSLIPTKHPDKEPQTSVGTKVAVIVIVVVLVVILVGSVAGWIYYAYSHPTSASGMWLMEHRPSQMKAKMANMKFWKRNGAAGDKYAVESTA